MLLSVLAEIMSMTYDLSVFTIQYADECQNINDGTNMTILRTLSKRKQHGNRSEMTIRHGSLEYYILNPTPRVPYKQTYCYCY